MYFIKQLVSDKINLKIRQVFEMFDLDKSNSIDKAEGILFWGKNFSKLNTEVMFEYIDRNGDNILQYE